MRLQDYDIDTRFAAQVTATERITADNATAEVRELTLEIDHADCPAIRELGAGKTVGVLAPGSSAFGQDHHFRLYTIADLPEQLGDQTRIKLCVRRCNYIDEYSGEEYRGVASNYLCDLGVSDTVTLTGPYGLPFEVPPEPDANLILIGTGTGIAPFRAFVKHLYRDVPSFVGRVWLFYGARNGLDLLYMNDEQDDFAQYYDHDTFQAFRALSPRPHWDGEIDWRTAIGERGADLWRMLGEPTTYVYVAGLEPVRDQLDKVLAELAGSPERWRRRKKELEAGGRWVELLY